MIRERGEACRRIRLCVDTYEQGAMKGRWFHPDLEGGGAAFESFVQFLASAEELLDAGDFPQSYHAVRTFAPLSDPPPDGAEGEESETGGKGTFLIRILFRRHASWQGSVTWLEGEGEQTFRSVLELILLVDSALSTGTQKSA